MLDLVCTILLIGRLCVTSPTGGELTTRLWEGFPTSGATITGEWWRADGLWSTDNVQAINPLRVSKACAGDRCVSYFLRCEEDTCRVAVSRTQESDLDFDIKAADQAQAREALKRFYYLVEPGDATSAVWFGDFKESTSFDDPYCGRRSGRTADGKLIWDNGCEFLND